MSKEAGRPEEEIETTQMHHCSSVWAALPDDNAMPFYAK
jgi:hypothetical protein